MIDHAIRKYGAKRVYAAAAARLRGDHAKLVALGISAVTIADADRVLRAAYQRLTAAERVDDYVDASMRGGD